MTSTLNAVLHALLSASHIVFSSLVDGNSLKGILSLSVKTLLLQKT